METTPTSNLDLEGREVNESGPLRVHVPFFAPRQMTIFDRLRLRQLELSGVYSELDYDSDGSFPVDDGGDDGDFFDRPTAAQLDDAAIVSRQMQAQASKPEQATPAPVKEEPPQNAADET